MNFKAFKGAIRSILLKPKYIYDFWWLRSKIKNSDQPLKIIIGSHTTLYDNWLPTNIETLNLLKRQSFDNLFQNKKVTRFLAEHVFEHISYENAFIALKNCYDYMEKGAAIRIAVPDGFHPNPDYINMVKPGGYGAGAYDHKLLYDYKKIIDLLYRAGFKVNLLEYYDEEGKFHFKEWKSEDGHIKRSKNFDPRFNTSLGYSSLIAEGIKP